MRLLASLEDFFASRGEDPPLEQDPETVMRATLHLSHASEVVRGYCRRTFLLATETVTLDGTGTAALLLPNPPIVDLIEIVDLDDVDVDTGDDGVVDPDDYRFDPDAGIVRLIDGGIWWKGFRNYTVELEHGYIPLEDEGGSDDASNLPVDIQMVTISLASRLFEESSIAGGTSGGDTTAIQLGEYREEFADGGPSSTTARATAGLTDDEAGRLDRYRLVRIG